MSELFMLLDGNNLMYREFHALPPMDNRPSDRRDEPVDGKEFIYTNALHGFLTLLLRLVEEYKPRWICTVFDDFGPTFRHEKYTEYKAGRKPTPAELRPQLDAMRALLPELGISVAHLPSYEADDLMGTFSRKARDMGVHTVIVSGDRDILQLTDELVNVLYVNQGIGKTVLYDPAQLDIKYGIPAPRIADMKGLMGDASDNIPGVPGVGEKTALKLLKQYGTLDEVLANGADIKGRLGERIRENAEQAKFSKWLATIDRDAPYEFDLAKCALFNSGADEWPAKPAPDGALPLEVSEKGWQMLSKYSLHSVMKRLRMPAALRAAEIELPKRVRTAVTCAADWLRAVSELAQPAAVYIEDTENAWRMSAADGAREVVFKASEADLPTYDLVQLAGMTPEQRARLEQARPLPKPDFHLPAGKYISHDIKHMWQRGFEAEFSFDTMLGAYLIDSGAAGRLTLAELRRAAGIPEDMSAAAAIYDLAAAQRTRMEREGYSELYDAVELPFARVLYAMEKAGCEIDCAELRRLGDIFAEKISEIEKKIYRLADTEAAGRFPQGEFDGVNLLSPKQLGEMLFDKLELKPYGSMPRKTQRGYSTDAETMEALAEEHEIAREILNYRKYTKLQGTYIQGLLKVAAPDADGETGRVYTSFDQTATATGRISSLEPNLQNIPVRTETGREIRGAFIARGPDGTGENWVLIDGDYSQIELRVLAHMAEHNRPEAERAMQQAFADGLDIHTATAGEVFDTPYAEVTRAQRSAAKAVNFGIVYGISDFGLARNLGISRARARHYIDRYKERYPGISEFMDAQVRTGYEKGYVCTLMGRRRYLPQLKSSNYNVRSFGERAAMNSPIQGTAADIIKLAMVKLSAALSAAGLRARLILQVHDEIIVEAPESEAGRVMEIMKNEMSGAVKLDVPLEVDISCGRNWMDCK